MAWKDIVELDPLRKYVACKLYNAIDELRFSSKDLSQLKRTHFKVNTCASMINIAKCRECGSESFDGAMYCKNKLCPVCAKMRERKYLSILKRPLERFCLDGLHKINFLTLTIKDTNNLKYGVDLLKNAWRYMTHQDAFSKYHFDKMFIGGLYSIEIKKGANSKLWHPHMHLLLLKRHFSKDFDRLKGLWENALSHVSGTNEKLGSVFIEGVYNEKGKLSSNINDSAGIQHAVIECVKYVTKFNFDDYSSSELLELCNVLKNNRLFSTFGCLRNLEALCLDDDYQPEIQELICPECGYDEFDFETVKFAEVKDKQLLEFKTRHNLVANEKMRKLANRKIKITEGKDE